MSKFSQKTDFPQLTLSNQHSNQRFAITHTHNLRWLGSSDNLQYLSVNYDLEQNWLPKVHVVFNSTGGDDKKQVSSSDNDDEEEESDEDEEPHFVVGGK